MIPNLIRRIRSPKAAQGLHIEHICNKSLSLPIVEAFVIAIFCVPQYDIPYREKWCKYRGCFENEWKAYQFFRKTAVIFCSDPEFTVVMLKVGVIKTSETSYIVPAVSRELVAVPAEQIMYKI